MVVKEYKCDVCNERCETEDITIVANFPRRKYEYARDTLGVKICGFETTVFEETHFCPTCLYKLVHWTKVIEEN